MILDKARLLLCVAVALPLSADAGKVTLSNPDKQVSAGGKLLCFYSKSIYTLATVTR